MKIIQINAVYATGSTGHIVQDIHETLIKKGHVSYVFWGITNVKDRKDEHFIRVGNTIDHKAHALARRILKNQGWNSRIATFIVCKKIKKIRPDIVHLHNLHSNYINLPMLLKFLGKENIAVLVTLHDCWFLTGYCTHYMDFHNCMGWKKGCEKCPAVNKVFYKKVQDMYMKRKQLFNSIRKLAVNGVSQWTTEIVNESLLSSSILTTCVYNWVDTRIFKPSDSKERVCRKYGIHMDYKVILGVSQGWNERKGLLEFIELSKRCKGKAVVILVGGCENVPNGNEIKKVGFVSNRQELVDLYSAADVYVNPSRMETFGLVTVEALACGTPVIAYNNTGSKELISKECGILIEDGNIKQMCAAVMDMITYHSKAEYEAACVSHVHSCFDKVKNIEKYITLYEEIMNIEK